MRQSRQRYVYFAVAGDMVKIGCSTQPLTRLGQIGEWIPFRIALAATMPGGFALETALHNQFADDWSHLEWFHLSPRLQRFIDDVRAGRPVEVASREDAHTFARRARRRAKVQATRMVQAAEKLAHGTGNYPTIRRLRPAYAQAALDTFAGPHNPPPTAETLATLRAYVAALPTPSTETKVAA